MRFCTALFAACAGLIVSIAGSLPASAATRNVVLLFGERVELPALSAMEAEIARTLRSNSAERTEIFSENMDLSRFGSPSYRAALRDFLHQKYSDKKIDVAVAVMAPALDFLLTSGDAIFPGASIAFSGLDRGELADRPLPRSVDGVFSKREFAPTLELALRLHPETRQIVVVSGTSDFEASLLADAKKEFTAFEKRVSFTYVSNVPIKDLLVQLSQLPKQSIVLFVSFFQDGAGESFVPQEVVERVSSASSVPVYGFTDQFLGRGIVGGQPVQLRCARQRNGQADCADPDRTRAHPSTLGRPPQVDVRLATDAAMGRQREPLAAGKRNPLPRTAALGQISLADGIDCGSGPGAGCADRRSHE